MDNADEHKERACPWRPKKAGSKTRATLDERVSHTAEFPRITRTGRFNQEGCLSNISNVRTVRGKDERQRNVPWQPQSLKSINVTV